MFSGDAYVSVHFQKQYLCYVSTVSDQRYSHMSSPAMETLVPIILCFQSGLVCDASNVICLSHPI
jgi:hypothetical protein